MSFAVHIWEYPAPRDSAEARLIRDSLERMRGPQNPRFIELAKRLTERHPCITTLDEEAFAELGVWSDGPLDGVTDDAVYGLGILSQHMDRVYPFVIQTANDLGLVATDDVSGAIYRPDGKVLEFDPADAEPRVSSGGLDMTRMGELLVTHFADLAEKHGYRKVGYGYVRGIDGGWQALVSRVAEADGVMRIDISVEIYRYDVMRKVLEMDPDCRAGDSNGRAFTLSSYDFIDDPLRRMVLRGPGDFMPITRMLRPIVAEKLLPLADDCHTLTGLDAVINSGRVRTRIYPLNHLVVSRLACNPAYDVLYQVMRDRGEIDDALHPWLSATRERLAAHLPCGHETVFVGSYGPGGAKAGILGAGK